MNLRYKFYQLDGLYYINDYFVIVILEENLVFPLRRPLPKHARFGLYLLYGPRSKPNLT